MSKGQMIFKGIELHKGQKRVLKEIMEHSHARYILIKTSRQWGKTLFAQQLLLYHSINHPKSKTAWFSPFISQCKNVMTQVLNAIIKSNIVKNYNKTERIIQLINGSYIYFFGVDNYDSIRGYSFDYVICDEAAFYPGRVFDEVIRPTLLVRGKKCYIISTPKGKNNWFFKYYVQKSPQYFSTEGNYTENPYVNLEEIESARHTLPEHIFRQEYLGEFLDSEYQIFGNIENCATLEQWSKPTEHNYAGLDLGRKNDYTVLTILNEQGEVVYIYRVKDILWNVQIKQVVDLLKKYNAYCFVDATGVGDAVFEQLKKQYSHVYPYVITGSGPESKQNLIEKLIISIQENKLKLPNKNLYKELHDEISTFQYVYSPSSRTIRYEAMSGCHDDIVLSLALANDCFLRKARKGSGIILRF